MSARSGAVVATTVVGLVAAAAVACGTSTGDGPSSRPSSTVPSTPMTDVAVAEILGPAPAGYQWIGRNGVVLAVPDSWRLFAPERCAGLDAVQAGPDGCINPYRNPLHELYQEGIGFASATRLPEPGEALSPTFWGAVPDREPTRDTLAVDGATVERIDYGCTVITTEVCAIELRVPDRGVVLRYAVETGDADQVAGSLRILSEDQVVLPRVQNSLQPNDSRDLTADDAVDVEGSWQLHPRGADDPIATLTLADGQLTGGTDCPGLEGRYETEGRSLTFDDVEVSGCPEADALGEILSRTGLAGFYNEAVYLQAVSGEVLATLRPPD